MCAIFAWLDHHHPVAEARAVAIQQGRVQRHRGPDWSGAFADDRFAIAHERLAIVDPVSGEQPLVSPDGRYVLDFNFATTPYCAFNPQYVCPLPPAENLLPFEVNAGERVAGSLDLAG
ncbi:MAG: DUF1684 domain-containing protein [Myxococcota bacterium]